MTSPYGTSSTITSLGREANRRRVVSSRNQLSWVGSTSATSAPIAKFLRNSNGVADVIDNPCSWTTWSLLYHGLDISPWIAFSLVDPIARMRNGSLGASRDLQFPGARRTISKSSVIEGT